MKITQDEAVDRQTILHIELEDEDLAPYLDRSYRKLAQQLSIPGFRKGKAPRTVVESFVGRESLIHESLDDMLPVMTQRAIDEQEIEAAGTPAVEIVVLDPVTVKATVPLIPEVDLGAYKDIRLDDAPVEITSEDVDGRLGELQDQASSWEPVEREVAAGDMTTMDAKGHVDEEYILNNEGAVYVVDLESTLPFAGFSEQLVGMEVGVEKEFTLKVPADHADNRFAGQNVHMSVTVKDVKQRLRPELDDEFAKDLGDEFETLEQLRERIRSDLQSQREQAAEQMLRRTVMDSLVARTDFELPPGVVERQLQHQIESFRREYENQVPAEVLESQLTRIAEDGREGAERRVREAFLLEAVAKAESVEATDEDVDQRLDEMAEARRMPPAQLRKLAHDQGWYESMRSEFVDQKALDLLVERADVEEVEPDDS